MVAPGIYAIISRPVRIPHLRYVIAALLFLATMINYTDRLALSVVSPFLRQEFGMGEQDYGDVVVFFMTAYAIFYALSGPIIDRLGTRRGFAVMISFWSAAAMSHALARGKRSLALCRVLLGAGEPGNWPAAAKAVAEWFPANQRAFGVGIFNAGSSIGSALAPPVVAWLTLHYGWRSAFIWTGASGLAWLVLWLVLYQPPHLSRWITTRERDFLKDRAGGCGFWRVANATRSFWPASSPTRSFTSSSSGCPSTCAKSAATTWR